MEDRVESRDGAYVVRGRVSRADGRSVTGLIVVVSTCGLREQTRVASSLTDGLGAFAVPYAWDGGGTAPNVRVEVIERTGGSLAASQVRFNAAPDETIDLAVETPAVPLAAFGPLHADVARVAERAGLAVEHLQDTDEQPDLAFVAAATTHHRDEVTRLVRAYQLAAALHDDAATPHDGDVQVLATLVYAALGALPDADPTVLANRDEGSVRATIEAAAAAGVIPPESVKQVPVLLNALKQRRIIDFLAPPEESGRRSAVVVALRALAPPPDVSNAVAEIALRYGVSNPDLWAALDADERVAAPVIHAMRGSVSFLDLSDHNTGLLETLLGGGHGNVEPATLVARTPEEWLELAGERPAAARPRPDGPARVAVGAPQAVIGGPEHYAATLTEAIERRHPTEKLRYELIRDQNEANPLAAARADVTRLLSNNPDLHLIDTPVTGLLTGDPEHDRERLAGLEDPQGTVRLVADYQRIYRLLPEMSRTATTVPPEDFMPSRYDAVSKLIRGGHRSALAITAMPRRAFITQYGPMVGGEGIARAIHDRAREVTDASLLIAAGMQEVAAPSVRTAIPQAVNWAQLFGPAESCACGQCQSVHSASAYLVDCLRFLDHAGALDALRARRDDLLDVLLTCANANTPLPYIDLANEVLEKLVAPAWFTPFDLPGTVVADLNARRVSTEIREAFAGSLSDHAELYRVRAGHWHLLDRAVLYSLRGTGAVVRVESASFQTSGSAEELRAAPQHVIGAAYRVLAAAVHPWSAPFDLPWAEVYEYLDRLGVRASELIDAFAPPGANRLDPVEAHDAAAGTYLGLSPLRFQIIAGQKTAGDGPIVIGQPNVHPEDFWGYARNVIVAIRQWDGTTVLARWSDALWRVPQFLSRSGLSYVELLDLLGCYLVNPAGKLVVASLDPADPSTCELDKLEIAGVPAAERVALATTIHRLVRLRDALGWTLRDLDRTLVALNAAGVERDPLVAVSIVERLRVRTGLDLAELIGWFGDLDHADYFDVTDDDRPRLRSFYDEIFRIPEAAEPDTPFVANAAEIGTTIGQHRIRLAARLGISAAALDRLRADPRVLDAADQDVLNLSTLSTLVRHSSFARWAGLGIDELFDAMYAVGFTPFNTASTAGPVDRAIAPVQFVEALDRLTAAGLAPADAAYVFTDRGARDRAPALDEAAIVNAVNAVVDTARPVLSTLDYPADATPDLVATELVKLGWPEPKARAAGLFFADRRVSSVQLAAAAAPPPLAANATPALRAARDLLRHDRDAGLLSVRRALSTAERDVLLADATGAFAGAVTALYEQPRAYARANLTEVLPAERSIPLDRAPANLALPRPLAAALRFDADRRVLTFRGDAALLALVEFPAAPLDPVWTAFKEAVAALAEPVPAASVLVDPSPATNRFFDTEADLDAMLDGTAPCEERCAYALARIRPWRWRVESDKLVFDSLAGPTGLPPAALALCRPIWQSLVIDPATDAPSALVRSQTAFSAAADSPVAGIVRRLHKVGLLVDRLAAPAALTAWLLRNASAIGGPDLAALPATSQDSAVSWDQAAAVLDFVRAWRDLRSADGSLLDLMDVVADPLASHADWWRLVGTIKGWEGEEVQSVTASPAFPGGFDRPAFYLRLLEQMRLARRCGVPVGVLKDWYLSLARSPGGRWTGIGVDAVATQVKAGVRAKVGRERWLRIAAEVNDPLRERRRDALLSYLLSRPDSPGTADALFARLLIDPQMAACMPTSRVVRAVGSIQTFVQRALMGLEPGVVLDEESATEWNTWRKQYRVWEANRKVFLYPENWMEPELRDDKSPLFAEVESRLLQSALPAPALTEAVADYVEGLRALSDLEIVGAYRQNELIDNVAVDVLHQVGRSNSLPRQHFYRRVEKVADMRRARWSVWEKLEVDIDSDYVLPVMTDGQAYILWPVVTPMVPKNTATDAAMPKQWEIKLAWTRRKGDSWLPKQVGASAIVAPNDQNLDPADAFRFQAQVMAEGIDVSCGSVRTITTGVVDPHDLVPTAQVFPAKELAGSVGNWFIIWPQVVDETGAPIAGVTVSISEWVNPVTLVYGIVPIERPPLERYSYVTGAQGTVPGPLNPLVIGIHPRWDVHAVLPSSLNAEFATPRAKTVTVTAATARGDHRAQRIDVRITFHRKPVVTVTTKLGWFGLFELDRTGKVTAYQWAWENGSPAAFLPANTTWSRNAFVEAAGSDDRLYLPELPGTALLRYTPGVFRLRPLSQPMWGRPPHYAFEIGRRRYHISYLEAAAQPEPIVVAAFHPYAEAFTRTMALHGERELLLRDQQYASDGGAAFRSTFLRGMPTALGSAGTPAEEISFAWSGAFSSYNWELFFHLPLSVAVQLTRNQRFAEAQTWLHYIYDPTSVEAVAFAPIYCWKFRPFFEASPESLAGLLGDPSTLHDQLEVLRTDPFNPYAIARLRIVAFMKRVVMAYLDNLIAWGDQMFARGTTEAINEATQLYLLAHQILGERPQRVPARAKPTPQTYRSLTEVSAGQDPALSELGMIAVEVSSFVPPAALGAAAGTGGSLGTMMYFCAAGNEKLLGYWSIVADRLIKLRHCLDIEGRFHIPALFDPPIDPALLVRARAAGVDLGDVLADAAAPLPHYRFGTLAQKATELVGEVRALGAALLTALEKRDGEALTLLRQRHELSMLPMVEQIRHKQIDEAKSQADGLRLSKATAAERQHYYQRLLGKSGGSGEPAAIGYLPAAVSVGGGGDDTNGLALSLHEIEHLGWMQAGNTYMILGSSMSVLAGVLNALPDSAMPIKWGGSHIGAAATAIGAFFSLLSANANFQGNRAATIGTYARRQDDWILQHNLAVNEMKQLDKQIIAADLRSAIAEQELANHLQQVDDGKEIEAYLKTKFTNQQLYDWQVGQLSARYFAAYRLAHTVAKRAERAFQQELGRESSDFVAFGYWDDLRKGLLAGERLHHDLKRMEVAYLEDNAREYEIIKNVSLESLNPAALVELRRDGVCEFTIPEWVFDLDYPGHFLRRIKNVAVTIPCVAGPYSSVNCTLSLQSSSIRISPWSAGAYPRKRQQGMPADDARFVDRLAAVQSIVTSTAQHDTGTFEANLHDERYLPFEGSGAISRWRVELRAESNSIDLNSVVDVILHLRYTAREGGAGLARAAGDSLAATLEPTEGASLFRLFSMRQEFPDDWHRLLSGAATRLGPLVLSRRRFPLLFAGKKLVVLEARDYLLVSKDGISPLSTVPSTATNGVEVELRAPTASERVTVTAPVQRVDLTVDPDHLDLLILCRYTAAT
jgi:hypothetical protein